MEVEPIIIRGARQYVAVSPRTVTIRIGTVGATEEEAREEWHREWDAWMRLRARRLAEEAVSRGEEPG